MFFLHICFIILKTLLVTLQKNTNWHRETPDLNSSYAPYKIYNIGNNNLVKVIDFIQILEKLIGKSAKIEFLPIHLGDVKETFADISNLQTYIGFFPTITIEKGLSQFVEWFKKYYLQK